MEVQLEFGDRVVTFSGSNVTRPQKSLERVASELGQHPSGATSKTMAAGLGIPVSTVGDRLTDLKKAGRAYR